MKKSRVDVQSNPPIPPLLGLVKSSGIQETYKKLILNLKMSGGIRDLGRRRLTEEGKAVLGGFTVPFKLTCKMAPGQVCPPLVQKYRICQEEVRSPPASQGQCSTLT